MVTRVSRTFATRLALGWLALNALQLGVWALFAPRSFYDNFPGMGRAWVSIDGPFNEHFVRDFGALNLALLVVLVAAAIRLSPDLITVAALSSLAWGIPHFVYHLVNTDNLDTSDIVMSLGGLAVSVLVAVGLLVSARGIARANS